MSSSQSLSTKPSKPIKKALTISFEPEIAERLAAEAAEDNRSISNMVNTLLKRYFDSKDAGQ